MVNAMDASEPAIFRWDTLKEIGTHDLLYRGSPVLGRTCQIELRTRGIVHVWRSLDGQQYFCHGLTFGSKDAPGGSLSPYSGKSVETILQEYFEPIPEATCQVSDILVWSGVAPATTPHSAVLINLSIAEGKHYLDYRTRLRTKNGLSPETNASLEQLIAIYGESYRAYRRR